VLVGSSEEHEQGADGQPPGTSFVDGSRWGGGASAVSFAALNAASIWALQPMQTHAPSASHGSFITQPAQSTIPGLPQ
jgi:hypothetical protein